jgi:hypothetical protein
MADKVKRTAKEWIIENNDHLLSGFEVWAIIADFAELEKERDTWYETAVYDKSDPSKPYFHSSRAEAAEKRLAEAREALADYGSHQMPCLLAQWHEGRPTSDGGYETRYGNQWYGRDEKPTCTCGFDAALTPAPSTEEGK